MSKPHVRKQTSMLEKKEAQDVDSFDSAKKPVNRNTPLPAVRATRLKIRIVAIQPAVGA